MVAARDGQVRNVEVWKVPIYHPFPGEELEKGQDFFLAMLCFPSKQAMNGTVAWLPCAGWSLHLQIQSARLSTSDIDT